MADTGRDSMSPYVSSLLSVTKLPVLVRYLYGTGILDSLHRSTSKRTTPREPCTTPLAQMVGQKLGVRLVNSQPYQLFWGVKSGGKGQSGRCKAWKRWQESLRCQPEPRFSRSTQPSLIETWLRCIQNTKRFCT
jgi:hypothetical protein